MTQQQSFTHSEDGVSFQPSSMCCQCTFTTVRLLKDFHEGKTGPMTGLIHNPLAGSAPNNIVQILFASPRKYHVNKNQEAALKFVAGFLKKKQPLLQCSIKINKLLIQRVSPLDDGFRLGLLNLPPNIVMQETDLQLSPAGARRWRQGASDLWLSLAPVKEPLNCSTV